MIVPKKNKSGKIEIDLTGPEGNAFYLLVRAEKWAPQLGKDPKKILEEMQSGDYENLVAVFEREFGSLVIMYR